jgi:class 3 adenylate cyclase
VKILVADDNRDNIELVSDILSVTGHIVVKAYDGISVLHMTNSEMPDLILLDVNMPNMTGFEVAEVLKSQPHTAQIPIIMLTALSDVESRVKGLALGADDYLPKPFSPKELLARVDRSLRAKLATDEMRVQNERVRLTFERFVDPQIVEQLLNNPDQIQLGGRTHEITVMFADLEGFTSLSEQIEPAQLLKILNAYHSLMVKIILKYGGTIDKFIGDCVMALYNTPNFQDDHISRAVKSALHIQDEVYWFHQKLEPQYRMLINFGIHVGTAVVGNVGTDRFMNFTAVGDTVNIAARLQGLAKHGQILVSQPVYDVTQEFIMGRSRGSIKIKGRNEAVSVVQISNTLIED